jgi:hypothetical protein
MDEEKIKEIEKEYQMYPAVPERIPASTFWPLTLAIGVMFCFWGILTSWIISVIGFVILIFSAGGWITDLNHENNGDGERKD